MKPLQVLILITKSNWGGAQRYVFDLATGLPKDRYAVEVMAGGDGPLIARLREAGIPANGNLPVGRDVSFFQDVRAAFQLIGLLRQKRPDVIHVNSSKIGGIGAFAGRMAGVKKIVFTAHGWAFNEVRPFWQKVSIRFLYWLTMFFSHQTIVVSEAARQQIRNWPFIQGKLVVVHNGISPETGFSKANARLELTRMDLGLKKAVAAVPESKLIWIGTIAELHHIKGHEYALRAIASCIKSSTSGKNIVYTIMGEGEERGRLESLIKELGIGDRVFLLGHVRGAAEYARAFDILLLASLSEALSYTLIEAGAASLPVIATTVGGIPEVIDDMESGVLIQPRNARELAHAISFMIEHPEDRRKYGAALREKVLKEFSLKQMIEGVEKVYLAKK